MNSRVFLTLAGAAAYSLPGHAQPPAKQTR